MAQEQHGTAEDSAAVPGQRPEPALPPDAGQDETGQAVQDAQDGGAAPTAPQEPVPPAQVPQHHKLRHTRLSGTWVAIVFFALVLVFLLIFILQNSRTVDVSYFGAHGHLSLGVALLLAAVSGILLTCLAGSARIMQLRATARKHRRADAKRLT